MSSKKGYSPLASMLGQDVESRTGISMQERPNGANSSTVDAEDKVLTAATCS